LTFCVFFLTIAKRWEVTHEANEANETYERSAGEKLCPNAENAANQSSAPLERSSVTIIAVVIIIDEGIDSKP
jgi:hypothetical protein